MSDDGDTWNCPVCGILALVSDLPGTSGCLHQPPRIGCPRTPLRQIGSCQIGRLGGMITVRCPREYDALIVSAGGEWEPAQHCWLIPPRRIGPVLRVLLREVDPLFRWGGIDRNMAPWTPHWLNEHAAIRAAALDVCRITHPSDPCDEPCDRCWDEARLKLERREPATGCEPAAGWPHATPGSE